MVYPFGSPDAPGLLAFSRDVVAATSGILGHTPADLEFESFGFADMEAAGLEDKISVRYQQVHDGLPVRGGALATLHTSNGVLIGVSSYTQIVRRAIGVAEVPSSAAATTVARFAVGEKYSAAHIDCEDAGSLLVPVPEAPGEFRAVRVILASGARGDGGAFAARVEVAGGPEAGFVLVDTGAFLSECGPHSGAPDEAQGATGTVTVACTPNSTEGPAGGAWYPNGVAQVQEPLEFVGARQIQPPKGGFTNEDGEFEFTGGFGTSPSFMYSLGAPGNASRVFPGIEDDWGERRLRLHADGQGVSLGTGGAPAIDTYVSSAVPWTQWPQTVTPVAEAYVAQADCLKHVQGTRRWFRNSAGLSQQQSLLDAAYICAVTNSGDPGLGAGRASAKGILWPSGGVATYYYRLDFKGATQGFANMAYSTTIAHEMGHVLLHAYGFTPVPYEGLHEGISDAIALLSLDADYIGKDWNGPGSYTRSGNNVAQVCQEFPLNCYGEEHANGEPLMGAIWDINQAIGPGPQGLGFDDPTDVILVSWIQLFGGSMAQVSGAIREELRDEWLLLDDYLVASPASLFGSGSPHFTEINDGFEAHGWPPFVDSVFSVDHLPVSSHAQASPILVSATVSPNPVFVGGPTGSIPPVIAAVRVVGQQNSQAFNYQMSLVSGTTDEFEYTLPQIPNNLGVVKYWFEIEDASGYVQHFPSGGGAFTYMVGEFTPYYSFDFDSSGTHGWTTAAAPGAASQDVFELGTPVGRAGANPPWSDTWFDPSGANSGVKAWGNDLGLGAFDGAYSDGEHCFLYSPAFLLDPAVDAVRVEYSRFLSLNFTDSVSVYLENVGTGAGNGQVTTLVTIPAGGSSNIQDGAWIRVSGNASIPGHNPSVPADNEFRIVFELESSASRPAGGWTIDDIDMFRLEAASGSGGQNSILLLANTVASVGDQIRARVNAGALHAGADFAVLWSSSLGSGTYGGYTTELGAPSVAATGSLDASGAVEVLLPAVPSPPGLPATYYIEAVVYDSGGAIVADSNVVAILVE